MSEINFGSMERIKTYKAVINGILYRDIHAAGIRYYMKPVKENNNDERKIFAFVGWDAPMMLNYELEHQQCVYARLADSLRSYLETVISNNNLELRGKYQLIENVYGKPPRKKKHTFIQIERPIYVNIESEEK